MSRNSGQKQCMWDGSCDVEVQLSFSKKNCGEAGQRGSEKARTMLARTRVSHVSKGSAHHHITFWLRIKTEPMRVAAASVQGMFAFVG